MQSEQPGSSFPAPDSTQGHPATNLTSQTSPHPAQVASPEPAQAASPEPARTSPRVIAIHALTIRGLREAIPGLVAAFAWLGVSGGLQSVGIVGIVLALVAAIVGLAALSWYRFTYQVANRQLIISQGIFSRRVRTIPVDRIRAIDSQVNPLHRVLGLARLKIEAAAAGTGEEEAVIDGLPTATAVALRADLLRARRRPAKADRASGGSAENRQSARSGRSGETGHGARPGGLLANRQSGGRAGDEATAGRGGHGDPGGPGGRGGRGGRGDPSGPGGHADGGTDLVDEPFEDETFEDVEKVAEVEYSRSRISWLFYAPLVGSYLAIPLAGIGFLSQFVDDIPRSWFSRVDVDPSTFTLGQVFVAALAAVALLAVGAVIGAVFLNWRFLLVRRDDLMVSERGLLTRRTVSVEIPRIRGYTLSEGLGMRFVRAARLTALITGVSNANSRSQLLPLGPRSEAVEVARRAVRPFGTPFRRHPVAALRRRLVRSVLPGAAVLVGGMVSDVPAVTIVGAVLALLGIPLGIDRYRSLGHASEGDAFAVRSGSLVRQSTVMQRRAVVGWKVQQSYFQKRARLSTVTALVGAGIGAYSALDADSSDALHLAASNGGRWARELLPAAQSAGALRVPPADV